MLAQSCCEVNTLQTGRTQSERSNEAEIPIRENLYIFSVNLSVNYPLRQGKSLHSILEEQPKLFQYCNIQRTVHKLYVYIN